MTSFAESSTAIPLPKLLDLYNLGFKLVPLAEDSKTPKVPSTNQIYQNTNYWTWEKLGHDCHKFSNIATTFGKSHITDSEGKPLYLNMLDIDSEIAFNRLCRLQNNGNEYYFIDKMCKLTYVVKTRKKYGHHIYWFSHIQHKPIRVTDCISGCEFEIKTDNSCGLGTLPPSVHRDDAAFHYHDIGHDKIAISDEFYNEIKRLLSDCLKVNDNNNNKTAAALTPEQIHEIKEIIAPYYKQGYRGSICFGLSGLLHKCKVDYESAHEIINIIAAEDEELKNRLQVLHITYNKDRAQVAGYAALLNTLENITDNASGLVYSIIKIIEPDDEDKNLIDAITEQFTFKTIEETKQIFWYDELKGLYVPRGEIVIEKHVEMLKPEIKTHEVSEVIEKIKRRTYVNLEDFDKDPNILNLKNGLLNIETGKFTEHTPKYLSRVQIPVNYDPKARCPRIARFLSQVLRPQDIHTALKVLGYCLYRSSKFGKAVLCYGDGDNGKSVMLELHSYLLGKENVSNVSLQQLDDNRFAAAELQGKLANICADLKAEKLSDTGNFKMLVTGDTIQVERKNGHPFKLKNTAKLIYSANRIPESSDQSYAYYRRWLIFPYERTFQGEEKDPNLIDKLTTPEELSGLLNLALISLRQLIKDNGFINVQDIESIREEYNQNSNSIEKFLASNLCEYNILDRHLYCPCNDLYRLYVVYCRQKYQVPVADNTFGYHLKHEKGIKREHKRVHGEQVYCYVGIGINYLYADALKEQVSKQQ